MTVVEGVDGQMIIGWNLNRERALSVISILATIIMTDVYHTDQTISES